MGYEGFQVGFVHFQSVQQAFQRARFWAIGSELTVTTQKGCRGQRGSKKGS